MNIEQTLDERGSRYGDFSDHARIAQELQNTMRSCANPFSGTENDKKWNMLSPVQRQALTVIADKIARILSGDPDYADNWHDIQGYAKLVEERLPKPKAKESTAAWIDWDPRTPTAHLGPRPVPNIVQVRLRDGTVCAYPGGAARNSWYWGSDGFGDGSDIVAYLVK